MEEEIINKKAVGVRIRDIRTNDLHMTMEEFAIKINSGKSNVSKWERGLNLPNYQTAQKIGRLVGTDADYIYFGHINFKVQKDLKNMKLHFQFSNGDLISYFLKFIEFNDPILEPLFGEKMNYSIIYRTEEKNHSGNLGNMIHDYSSIDFKTFDDAVNHNFADLIKEKIINDNYTIVISSKDKKKLSHKVEFPLYFAIYRSLINDLSDVASAMTGKFIKVY